MVTIAQVLDWRPSILSDVGSDLSADVRILLGLQDEIDAGRVPTTWTGDAALAAGDNHEKIRLALNDHVATLSSVATAVSAAAGAMDRAQQLIQDAVTIAPGHGFSINTHTGAVTDEQTPPTTQHELADRRRALQEIIDRLEQGLRAAHAADVALTQALNAASRGIDGGSGDLADAHQRGVDAGQPELPEHPIKDGTPADWAAWFESLSPEQQAWIIANDPDLIGNRDGIPAWARDEANRNRIADMRSDLQKQLSDLGPQPSFFDDPAAWADWKQRRDALVNKLDGLDTIEDILTQHGDNRQLLLLDATGSHQLKAAMAVGNVDTADNVAVFTPGLTSTVAGMKSTDLHMANLQREAARDGESVATVLWLGYEAPQIDTTLLSDRTVASDRLAREGADDLASFYNGIDASRDQDPRLTALGHSYGSLTTGLALQNSTGVDAAVFFGSPGIGADERGQLDVPKGESYSISSSTDPVANFNRFGKDPDLMDDMQRLDAASRTTPEGEALDRSGGHTNYLNQGSTGQHNIAAVVAGDHEDMLHDNNSQIVDRTIDDGKGLADDIADGVRDAGDWAGDRVRDAGDWAGDRVQDASDWADDRAQDVRDLKDKLSDLLP